MKDNPTISFELQQPENLPKGIKLVQVLEGHEGFLTNMAFDPTGSLFASCGTDGTARLWDASTGAPLRVLTGHENWVRSVAFDPCGQFVATGSDDLTIKLWDPLSGKVKTTLRGHDTRVFSVAFSPDGKLLASGSDDRTIKLWDLETRSLVKTFAGKHWIYAVAFSVQGTVLASGGHDGDVKLWNTNSNLECDDPLVVLHGHTDRVWTVAFHPTKLLLASGSLDNTVRIWDVQNRTLLTTLEKHSKGVQSVAFSSDGLILASKSRDGIIALWDCDTWKLLGVIPEPALKEAWLPGIAFHPKKSILCTGGALENDKNVLPEKWGKVVHCWDIDLKGIKRKNRHQAKIPTYRYINAKVIMMGDSSVGKSALARVLNNLPYQATDSTPGRNLWRMHHSEQMVTRQVIEKREVFLWDLAGQHGYRLIHQLHLGEVAVAIIAFDGKSEKDLFAGVRYWDRALRAAHQRDEKKVPMRKFLVSCRNDRGGISLSPERISEIVQEMGFDGYFSTSANQGWNVSELKEAVLNAINWKLLPSVDSNNLFINVQSCVNSIAESGQLMVTSTWLFNQFCSRHPLLKSETNDFTSQFDLSLGRLANLKSIRQMSFGGYVLLKPELLDAYGAAIVLEAKKEPDGLGSISENVVMRGDFFVPPEQRVMNLGEQELLIHAAVEELIRHDLAYREGTSDGTFLVFPSEFIRDYEDAPEPDGKALMITFEGPVQNIYATLAVRLAHSSAFSASRARMWRNASEYEASEGGTCGIYVHEFTEGRGRMTTFYKESPSMTIRFNFEEFILSHVASRAVKNSVKTIRYFCCPKCSTSVPHKYVEILREKNLAIFDCPCGGAISLVEPKESIKFRSRVEEMMKSADGFREIESLITSTMADTKSGTFKKWAGGDKVILAIATTDAVASNVDETTINDALMADLRGLHFDANRTRITQFNGRELKTIGSGFIVAFHNAADAISYLFALRAETGDARIKLRASLHVGAMSIERSDAFGAALSSSIQLLGTARIGEICVSERAMADAESLGGIPSIKKPTDIDHFTGIGSAQNLKFWRLS